MTGTWWGAKPSYVTLSKLTIPSRSPAPFLMARSSVSRLIDARLACSMASRSRGLAAGSAPAFAAIITSLATFPRIRPFAAALAVRPLCFHCAPMAPFLADAGASTRVGRKASQRGFSRG